MELSNAPLLARFIMGLFVILILLAFAPMLSSAFNSTKEALVCSEEYGILCLLLDLSLPFLFIFIVGFFISYIAGSGR